MSFNLCWARTSDFLLFYTVTKNVTDNVTNIGNNNVTNTVNIVTNIKKYDGCTAPVLI